LDGILDRIGDFGWTENEILDSMFVQSLYIIDVFQRPAGIHPVRAYACHIWDIRHIIFYLIGLTKAHITRTVIMSSCALQFCQLNMELTVIS